MDLRTRDLFPVLGLCLVPVAAASATADTNRPNIILCMTDDQGWGDTGCNG